jgi:hypothetical protein
MGAASIGGGAEGATLRGCGGSALATLGGSALGPTTGGDEGVASAEGGGRDGEALTPGVALTKNASIPSIGAKPAGISTIGGGPIARWSSQ